MAGWLAVVSAEHVARGVELGIAQTNHGKRPGLARMRPGDLIVYYSPHRRLHEHSPVQAFTALGEVADDEIWQADEGDFTPWRRRIRYRTHARQVSLSSLRDRLHLTATPHWGYQLRRGLIPLDDHDLEVIETAMTGGARTTGHDPAGGTSRPALW